MFGALKGLLQVLQDDATVSSYELQSTGLVTALLRCLHQVKCIIYFDKMTLITST